jgi:hypothetical protein
VPIPSLYFSLALNLVSTYHASTTRRVVSSRGLIHLCRLTGHRNLTLRRSDTVKELQLLSTSIINIMVLGGPLQSASLMLHALHNNLLLSKCEFTLATGTVTLKGLFVMWPPPALSLFRRAACNILIPHISALYVVYDLEYHANCQIDAIWRSQLNHLILLHSKIQPPITGLYI